MQPLSCRYFTYRELEAASQNWSASHIIGDGGFGRVYRGSLSSGKPIAIKRLDRHGLQVRTPLSMCHVHAQPTANSHALLSVLSCSASHSDVSLCSSTAISSR